MVGSQASFALTVDLGNSFVKLCLFDLEPLVRARSDTRAHGFEPSGSTRGAPERVPAQASLAALTLAWEPEDAVFAALEEWIGTLLDARKAACTCVLFASVAAPNRTGRMRDALADLGLAGRLLTPSAGLINATLEPQNVGQDRLFAARGAVELVRANTGHNQDGVVVVDAGTALCVDAVRLGADGLASFLGGAIAPGPDLLAEALGRRGARLARIEPVSPASAWGRNTEGALRAGICVGFRGAAARLVAELGCETGLEGAPVVLTGGAATFLLEPTAFLSARELRVDPMLIERGLLAAFLDADDAGGRT